MPKPFSKLSFLLLLLLPLCWNPVSAQTSSDYETISTAQGLSQGMIFDLLQDREGFIWVATKNGLNRYDGYTFKIFSSDPYNTNSLSSNTIIKLFEDSKGRLWVGTEDGGINIYDKKSGKFHRILYKPEDVTSLSGNAIRCIAELADGRMLVSAYGAGFNMVELPDDFFEKPSAPLITRFTLPHNNDNVYAMGKDRNGNMWIGGFDGSVYRFNPGENSLKPLNNAHLLNDGFITTGGAALISGNYFLYDGSETYPLFDTAKIPAGNILLNPKGPLWKNYYTQLSAYHVTTREAGKPLLWDMLFPESLRVLYPFITDRSGIVWSGSVGYGLFKYNKAGSKFNQHLLPGFSTRWIKSDRLNNLYVVDYSYSWIKINGQSTEKDPFKKFPQITLIDNFLISKTGKFWLKSETEGYKHYYDYDPVSGKLTQYPLLLNEASGDKQPLLEDSKGSIWFPVRGGLVRRIQQVSGSIDSFTININNTKPLNSNSVCTALYEDGQGVYWVGTQEGFAKVIFTGQRITPDVKWFYNKTQTRNSLSYNHVSCFMDDPAEPDKYLWICTKGGGLNRMNKMTGDFFHLTSKEGLPDDVVYGILADDAKNIWGSTNNGIFCLLANPGNDSTRWIFRNFTKAYGLQGDEFNTGAYVKLPDGKMAFGGVNGLNIFEPKALLAGSFSPNVYVTNILVNNSPVLPGDKTELLQQNIEQTKSITLDYQQDILTLEFSALDFTAPGQNKYRYQLMGIDKSWVESGNRRSATYLHLPAGKYTFKVQGSNSQGTWSDNIFELQVKILPPWWRSWWAYIIYALLLAWGIRLYFRFSINKARLQAQLSYEQLEAKRVKELDTIKTQLYTNITHEFRTPLTVILGMAQQVIEKPAEQFNSRMNMIMRNGRSLLNLVNEMLDLSKLETGKMPLQIIQGDVIHFLRYIVESFHSLANSQQKQLHFLTDIDALFMEYDQEKIRQIVSNLLSNAIKFTPETGNVYIGVMENVLPDDSDNSILVIKVKDTGIGIPEDQLQHIFDRFYQLDNSHTRKTEGTGIGLALTKELVKLMNGEIIVKSPPPGTAKGSEFTVSLPLKKVAPVLNNAGDDLKTQLSAPVLQPGFAIPVTGDEEKNVTAPLILLVEDNADVVAYTASCLPDYRLAVGKDGREGFDIATDLIPDLIITDVMMPFVDGFELTAKLRASEYTSHIPIIMLTAKADMRSKIEGLQSGAEVYLEKPFNKEELLVRIQKLLEMRKHLQLHYVTKAGLNTNSNTVPTPDVISEDIKGNKIEDAFVKKVREAIEQHLTDVNFSVEQLCKLVFMSHSQLHRKLDALTGYSPNKFIRMLRLKKATTLLLDQSSGIASVALDCGYSDPGYFARIFKQEFGMTPQEWRAANTGEQSS